MVSLLREIMLIISANPGKHIVLSIFWRVEKWQAENDSLRIVSERLVNEWMIIMLGQWMDWLFSYEWLFRTVWAHIFIYEYKLKMLEVAKDIATTNIGYSSLLRSSEQQIFYS